MGLPSPSGCKGLLEGDISRAARPHNPNECVGDEVLTTPSMLLKASETAPTFDGVTGREKRIWGPDFVLKQYVKVGMRSEPSEPTRD